MEKSRSNRFGFKQTRQVQGLVVYRLLTLSEVYLFRTESARERFIAAEGIVIVEHGCELAAMKKPTPTYNEAALLRAPQGHNDTDTVTAKKLARASVRLWVDADPATREWWRQYCQTNGNHLSALLELVTGLNLFEARYRRGGGLLPVDWLSELRRVAADRRWSDPDQLLDGVAAGFLFEEQ